MTADEGRSRKARMVFVAAIIIAAIAALFFATQALDYNQVFAQNQAGDGKSQVVATATSPSVPLAAGQQQQKGLAVNVSQSQAAAADVMDPLNSVWSGASETKVALHPQNIVTPHGGGSIHEIAVKAMYIDSGLAVHMAWSDATKDDETVHQVKFRDAAAIQFPIGDTKDTVLSMGSPHGPVNIWQWKADWEPDAPRLNTSEYGAKVKENAKGPTLYNRIHVDSAREPNEAQGLEGPASGIFNLFPQNAHQSPVEDIVAVGVSSISTKPDRLQLLKGRGIWQEGRWNVVVFKPFSKAKDPTSPQFKQGEKLNAAFAVWNGSARDRNGMKSVSNWVSFNYH